MYSHGWAPNTDLLCPSIVVESWGLEPDGPGFKSWLCPLLAKCPEARNLTPLSLHFLNLKIGLITNKHLTLFCLAPDPLGLTLWGLGLGGAPAVEQRVDENKAGYSSRGSALQG